MSESRKVEITEDALEKIAGGIDFMPDFPGANSGACGPTGGDTSYRYDNADDVKSFIQAHAGDKDWASQEEFDNYMLPLLLDEGLIH